MGFEHPGALVSDLLFDEGTCNAFPYGQYLAHWQVRPDQYNACTRRIVGSHVAPHKLFACGFQRQCYEICAIHPIIEQDVGWLCAAIRSQAENALQGVVEDQVWPSLALKAGAMCGKLLN
jgi:hypothetical protein